MSDDIEDLLRAEFASRAESSPAAYDGLAEAAIGGARRIRRRRRATAAGGGLAVIALAAVTAVWTPWDGEAPGDPPPAATTSTDEAQTELDIEFVVERDGAIGVVGGGGEFVPLPVDQRPTRVERLEDAYLVSSDGRMDVVAADGSAAAGFDLPAATGEITTEVSGDATEFAVGFFFVDSVLQRYELYPTEVERLSLPPRVLEFDAAVSLEDWNEDLVVLSANLTGTSGGAAGTYLFNEDYRWGIDTAAVAGFESAVIVDAFDPQYVCVSDLEPGGSASETEECGYLDTPATEAVIAESARDESAVEFVAEYSDSAGFTEGLEDPIEGDEALKEQLFAAEQFFTDPGGRWQIGFSSRDETWALLNIDGQDAEVSELTVPDGALMPVESHI
ncbi:hypothetical protein GCM10027447_03510 [Glycomyces halotolerans]